MSAKLEREEAHKHRPADSRRAFFPAPDDFAHYVGVPVEKFRGPRKVLVSLDVLRTLIGLAAAGCAFDPDFYLEQNPDLRHAVANGNLGDPRTHFVNDGYFERRPASEPEVDEQWYVEEYADISDAIATRTVESATQHYFTTGRKEGRLPRGGISDEIRRLISLLHERA